MGGGVLLDHFLMVRNETSADTFFENVTKIPEACFGVLQVCKKMFSSIQQLRLTRSCEYA